MRKAFYVFCFISLSCFLLGWTLFMLPLLDRSFATLGTELSIASIVLVLLGFVTLLCGFVVWLIGKLRRKKK